MTSRMESTTVYVAREKSSGKFMYADDSGNLRWMNSIVNATLWEPASALVAFMQSWMFLLNRKPEEFEVVQCRLVEEKVMGLEQDRR